MHVSIKPAVLDLGYGAVVLSTCNFSCLNFGSSASFLTMFSVCCTTYSNKVEITRSVESLKQAMAWTRPFSAFKHLSASQIWKKQIWLIPTSLSPSELDPVFDLAASHKNCNTFIAPSSKCTSGPEFDHENAAASIEGSRDYDLDVQNAYEVCKALADESQAWVVAFVAFDLDLDLPKMRPSQDETRY